MNKNGSPGSSAPRAGGQWTSNPFLWGLVGFCAAMIFCEFTWVRPLRAQLDAREKSLQEWERINRQEREAIATIKTISTEELKKWVATMDEQNKRFAELQSKLHQQEIELTGPATSYILIASVVILAVIGLVVFWLRDANASAATTLENVASLAPDEMMRALLVASIANREPINVLVSEKPAAPALPAPPNRPALPNGDSAGEVVLYFAEKGHGFIRPDGEPDMVWFHVSDVLSADRAALCQGIRVVFRRGTKAVSVRCSG
uniref:Cold shock domain-containing protein n=1 Tax=Schlesneria paludicola TaxID=360056 RepID=A0A7C4QP03_9PLAN